MAGLPILWHIPVSHYSEKVRWALDYKEIEHQRRAPVPGVQPLLALARTRGQAYTFPVMKLDGRSIGDSTAIIEALEARWPEPPLYPMELGDRRRALELEDWFDENLGPHVRLLVWHELARDRERLEEVAAGTVPPALGRLKKVIAAGARSFVAVRYRVYSEESAERARRMVLAGLDKLESELGERDYLVGEAFTVADLTAASLFYPIVLPREGPSIITTPPAALERFREPLKQRRGYRWVEDMFTRHRGGGAGR